MPFYLLDDSDDSEAKEYMQTFILNMSKADSAEKQISLIKEYDYEVRRHNEIRDIARVRFSKNVSDETRADLDYLNNFHGNISQYVEFKEIVESKYAEELEAYFGKRIIDLYREYIYGASVGGIERELSVLSSEYLQLTAQHSSQGPLFKKAANSIFDKMLILRNNLAKANGYDDYGEYAYKDRFFSLSDVQVYIENVKDTVLPVYKKLDANLPNSVDLFPAYRLVRKILTEDEIYKLSTQALRKSFDEIIPMIDYLERNEMIDVERRPNKGDEYYTIFFTRSQLPFIFLPGPTIDALIHELGHAFELWSWPKIDVIERFLPTPESSEVASICMEVIASENYELIYYNTANYARMQQIHHLTVSLLESVMNCEFELELYKNPKMSLDERNRLYDNLRKEYGVGRQIKCWQDLYIFSESMYYISYSLDYAVAFELLHIQKDNPTRAKEMYLDYIQNPTEKNFMQRLKIAGFSNPFEKKNLEELAIFLDSIFSSDEYLYPE